jgi:hypothetical protein
MKNLAIGSTIMIAESTVCVQITAIQGALPGGREGASPGTGIEDRIRI